MKTTDLHKEQNSNSPAKLALTVKETAAVLGVAPISIYRLLARGHLRASTALRKKIISVAEVQRFLETTSK